MYQKKSRKIYYKLLFILAISFFSVGIVFAQEKKTVVNYEGVIVDSDLDGLTDEGERQIFGTNPILPDTDGDGFFDSVEVLGSHNPLDSTDPRSTGIMAIISKCLDGEIPWAWYLSRASGFVAFIFLWLTILFGLSIRNNILKKIFQPIYSFELHSFLAVSSIFWGLFHGISFLFHGEHSLRLGEAFVPFYLESEFVNTNYLALGILAFYGMFILTATSYIRKHISHKLWRAIHFLHPVVFLFVVIHGYKIGTDMQNIYVKNIFIGSSIFLVIIYFSSLFFAIWNKFSRMKNSSETTRTK